MAPIAKITGQGLAAIAFSTALLWACLIGEHLLVKSAVAERHQVMREIRLLQLRRKALPVSSPAPAGNRFFSSAPGKS